MEAARNINSAAAERTDRTAAVSFSVQSAAFYTALLSIKSIKMKEVIKVVLLDELKSRLGAYEEPLKDLRDSL